MDPQSVFVGCYRNPATGRILNVIPESNLPGLQDLITFVVNFLRTLSGTLAMPAACDVTFIVKDLLATPHQTAEERRAVLDAARALTKKCEYRSARNILDQAPLMECNLQHPLWKKIAAVEFRVTPQEPTLTNNGLGSIVGVIDDFAAKGHLKICG